MSRSSAPAHQAVDLWRPLRTPLFRQLLIADVLSDVGTFMQGVGSARLLVSLGRQRMESLARTHHRRE
jgi:hypothetical protein